jgi:hypothetical protein
MKDFRHYIIDKYNNGPMLELYGDDYSIAQCRYSEKNDQVYMQWAYPQINRQPADKCLPWKIKLGSKDKAINILRDMIKEIQGGENTEEDAAF